MKHARNGEGEGRMVGRVRWCYTASTCSLAIPCAPPFHQTLPVLSSMNLSLFQTQVVSSTSSSSSSPTPSPSLRCRCRHWVECCPTHPLPSFLLLAIDLLVYLQIFCIVLLTLHANTSFSCPPLPLLYLLIFSISFNQSDGNLMRASLNNDLFPLTRVLDTWPTDWLLLHVLIIFLISSPDNIDYHPSLSHFTTAVTKKMSDPSPSLPSSSSPSSGISTISHPSININNTNFIVYSL